MEHRGVSFVVGHRRPPWSGIIWRIERFDHLGRKIGETESQGCFYNVPEHPEGAYAWAEDSARRYIDKLLDG